MIGGPSRNSNSSKTLLSAGSDLKSQGSCKISEDSFDSDTNIDKKLSHLKAFEKVCATNICSINLTTPSIVEREESKRESFDRVNIRKAIPS